MRKIDTSDFMEEIQDYIAANSSLGYVVGTDFFIGDILDIDAVTQLQGLTMYDEGSSFPGRGRRLQYTERSVRFVVRDSSAQAANNRCWSLFDWMGTLWSFNTTSFDIKLARFDKLPSLFEARAAGVYLSDIVATFLVYPRWG